MNALVTFLQHNPSLIIFAALAAGYALGKVKFGTFSLGSTTSVLLAAIVIGALVLKNKEYDLGLIKTISFGFFIFAIGYRVGPDFVSGLKRGGMKYVLTTVFFCVIALVAAILLAKAFGLNAGYGGGMLGGALTQSSVIGTADGAILHLANQEVTSNMNLKSDVAVAYAVTYIFGTAGLIVLLKVLAKLWKFDLPAEARKAEAELGSAEAGDTVEAFHWSNLVMPRAYSVENQEAIGSTIAEIQSKFPNYVAIDMLKRGNRIIKKIEDDLRLEKGDVVVLTGYRRLIFKACDVIGPEVDDKYIREMIGEILGICLTNKKLDGKTFNEIFSRYGQGCFIHGISRQGHDLPLGPNLKLYTGDVMRVIGNRPDVERLVNVIGYPERESSITDLVTVGIGIIAGTLVGLLAINIGGVPVTLGVGGGVLVSGIFFGWLRSTRPTWGSIPVPTQWIFTNLGLNLFIACVGISAGPRAVAALQQAGINIFFAGACLTIIPHVLTWIFGLYALKLNPVLLLGAMTGAGTCTAALNSVKEDSNSSISVIGYTVPYAIGNVLLTVWGALIVSIL
ncbi:MAG: aspartate-alanine antiporter [Candidatus Aegiribacteria sp.]|nr:aspartate-alanine antiporter [Candidatus Aegiribacteria sp.]